MKRYNALIALLIGVLAFGSPSYAQEYDDMYFTSADRMKMKKNRGEVSKPETVSSQHYYAEPPLQSSNNTTASARFANPEFQGANTSANNASEFDYYAAPEQTPFTSVNPRPGQNLYANTNAWGAANPMMMDPFMNPAMMSPIMMNRMMMGSAFMSPFAMNRMMMMDPFMMGAGMYDPFWGGGWGMGPSMAFGVGFGWNRFNRFNTFGWNSWGMNSFNSWGWGGPSMAFGWNSWCTPFSPFGTNVVVVNNRFAGGDRFVRNVYNGPINRRSSMGVAQNAPVRTVNTASNQRAAMNRRYVESLNSRRSSTTQSNGRSANVGNTTTPNRSQGVSTPAPTRRTTSPAVSNPRSYTPNRSTPSYNSGGSRGSSSPAVSPTRRSSTSTPSPTYRSAPSSSSPRMSTPSSSSPSRSSGSSGSSGVRRR